MADEHWLNQLLYVDMKTFLPCLNLTYTDKMSMAASTEVRVPLLDDELVALSGRIPPNLKLRHFRRKYIFKRSMEGMLPKEVIWRTKAGFGAPIRSWLVGDLKPMLDELLSPRPWQRGASWTSPRCSASDAQTTPDRRQRTAALGDDDTRALAAAIHRPGPATPRAGAGLHASDMKQVVQRLRNGQRGGARGAATAVDPGGVLVDVRASLLSAGTERAKVEAGRKSLIGKARSRPDQVQQVIDKARRDGIREAACRRARETGRALERSGIRPPESRSRWARACEASRRATGWPAPAATTRCTRRSTTFRSTSASAFRRR